MNSENLSWCKSSASQPNGSCVELATDGQAWLAVRDSKNPGPVLSIDVSRLVRAVKHRHLGAMR